MASDKKAWINSQIQKNNWALTFRHPLPARLQMLATLIRTLQGHIFQDDLDQIIWKAGPSASFTVRSQYQLLQPSRPQDIALIHI